MDNRSVTTLSQDATAGLQKIVDEFNTKYENWRTAHSCEANLIWGYTEGKTLLVESINYPVFRRPPPSARTLEEMTKKLEKEDALEAQKQ